MSLISDRNIWMLLFVMTGTVAFAIWLESKYRWAAKVSALVIVLLLSILFSNVHLIPETSVVYDCVWNFGLPLALPMLLLRTDIRRICRESGQLLAAFLIGACGTMVGALLAYLIFQGKLGELPGLTAMMTGTYIGGSVNFAVLSSVFEVSAGTVSSATIADNLNMAIYFLILMAIPVKTDADAVSIQKKKTDPDRSGHTAPLSAKALAIGIALSVFIVAVSDLLSGMWGNRYFWITTCSVLIATLFSEHLDALEGIQEIAVWLMYCFIFAIGAPASVREVIEHSPLILLFAMVIVVCNMVFTFGIGSLLHIDRKMLIIASNANVGGPTTAAGMAAARGWDALVGPAILVGCLGYMIGNYLGILIGNMLL